MAAHKEYVVGRDDARRTVAEWLHRHLHFSWNQARDLVRAGVVRVDGRPCRDSTERLKRGQHLRIEAPPPQERRGGKAQGRTPAARPKETARPTRKKRDNAPIVRYCDEHLVVVDKPAGLTTVRHESEAAEFGRGRRFLPATLADLLPGLLAQGGRPPVRVRAVHRIDKETSGLVAFALTPADERQLGEQFRAHSLDRVYLALVRGQARDGRIESWLVRDRGDGRRGSGPEGQGQRAVTHVRVAERLGEYSLVECRLETGRTHQIRIHLGEAGTPLCGDHVYDRPLHGSPLPDGSGAARVLLHAASLGLDHPADGRRLSWTAPLPRDMSSLLNRLRNDSAQQ
jgi:23S rRNA pseudouridine1911/1915/1917 synthase